ncbi:clostripain-related cysteine peptidase [Mesorhizobium abyssinicae]|uniref:Clostripain-related cysteine peptidase n=1 Tax=Mesorhizobium abyssinicae TaxID=1209958 RepID=A0ABU5ASA4_9HYPH|nr:clostripain-related cysteine peptidase [Mesorhizobium abyssinicae]MDX8540092.1 clostripain-related cysteine peptidase [Mesorhizobium abyssinicae]
MRLGMGQRMLLIAFVLLGVHVPLEGSVAEAAGQRKAEWTVMVFMNAKNNLEPDAITNFEEMASVGSTANLNILVQMGRPKVHETVEAGNWAGVLRFRVTKGQEPVPADAAMDLRGGPAILSDLGSREAFQDFVEWSIRTYPARRYMLIIWNHGQGWRFQTAKSFAVNNAAPESAISATELAVTRPATPSVGGFKAVSFDADTGHYLFNSDIQLVLEKVSKQLNAKIDVLGFDACLMSMIETAYAFRNSVTLLIGSEELEPAAGWDYVPFLRLLAMKPTSKPLAVTEKIVAGYRARFGDSHTTTLSVVDQSKTEAAAVAISKFAALMSQDLEAKKPKIGALRGRMNAYGAANGLNTSVDFVTFAEGYGKIATRQSEKDAALEASKAVREMVVSNYASAKAKRKLGSTGIAIYFPPTRKAFEEDIYHDGYLKGNDEHVVEFVKKERWADFIQQYLSLANN